MSDGFGRVIAIVASLVVALVVGIGLRISGPPAVARQQAIDARRINDLRNTRTEVYSYWKRHHALPATLDSLSPVPADSA